MIEAMKQALEALEDFVDVIKYDNEQDDIGRRACCDVLSYNPHSENCKAKQAITAIKAALAQPEQEPVAWRIKVETKLRDGSLDVGYQPRNEKMSAYDEPLYTHPQRTWVGLTDEEVDKAWRSVDYTVPWEQHRIDIAKAIEAKLRQKNHVAQETNS
jgi:hypothetical protein